MNPQQPRPIESTDNTIDFDSDEESLDRYLGDRALTNHLADSGVATSASTPTQRR